MNLASRCSSPRTRPIDPSLDLEAEILRLKKERNAVLLAHYYQDERDPGRRRLHRRLAPALAGGREDEGRRHLLRRRPLHGRDGEDPEPRADRRRARPGRRLLARRRLPGRPVRAPGGRGTRAPSSSATSTARAEVKALSRLHLTSSNAEKIVRQHPGGQDDPLRARQEPRALAREDDRPQDDALAGELHRPRDVQPAEARRR